MNKYKIIEWHDNPSGFAYYSNTQAKYYAFNTTASGFSNQIETTKNCTVSFWKNSTKLLSWYQKTILINNIEYDISSLLLFSNISILAACYTDTLVLVLTINSYNDIQLY